MISFTDYSKIANNYCICYFGHSDEYLVQLRLLKPILEKEFSDLNIYIGCKDEKTHILGDCRNILKLTELKIRKKEFAYISELKYNGSTHPIEDLMVDSKIRNFAIPTQQTDKTHKCVIVSNGSYPTTPLEKLKIENLKKIAITRNMSYELDTDIKGAGLVMGVESVQLCEAAANGIETILIPTGVGARLYQCMFPQIKILSI